MNAVAILNCRLRIVRHGGWSWGAGRRELAARAVRILPELIAARIGELADSDGDVVITQPIRINVSISQRQLLDLLASPASKVDPMNAVAQKILSQVDTAIQRSVLPAIAHAEAEKQSIEQTVVAQPQSTPAELTSTRRSLIQLLIAWKRKGDLISMLLRMSAQTLQVWHDGLMATREIDCSVARAKPSSESGSAVGVGQEQVASTQTIESIIQEFARMVSQNLEDQPAVLRCRIMASVEVMLARGIPPSDPVVRLELDKLLPIAQPGNQVRPKPKSDSNDYDLQHTNHTFDVESTQMPVANRGRQTLIQPTATTRNWEVHISSAVPFLILRPLSDIGYLDTLAVALEAAGLNELAPAFATALAYKVLDVPDRGWRRNPESRRAAATMAGVADEISDSFLEELVFRSDDFTSALNAVLANAVLAGRELDQPLFLSRMGPESDASFLLADALGLFPVAIETELDRLVTLLDQCESSLLLIEANAADPRLLAQLQRRGHRFLIDVPPTRGENWRVIKDRKSGRWWTNDAVTPTPKLARQAKRFSDIAHCATEFSNAIGTQRLAIPNANHQQLEQTLTAATGVALSQIAWDLWRASEPTDPMLTLERFAELDANVQFTETEVRVRLPLGRRSIDLYEHGLLQDIVGVPWLGERIVKFSKG